MRARKTSERIVRQLQSPCQLIWHGRVIMSKNSSRHWTHRLRWRCGWTRLSAVAAASPRSDGVECHGPHVDTHCLGPHGARLRQTIGAGRSGANQPHRLYTLSKQAGCWHWQAISTSLDPASRHASLQYFSLAGTVHRHGSWAQLFASCSAIVVSLLVPYDFRLWAGKRGRFSAPRSSRTGVAKKAQVGIVTKGVVQSQTVEPAKREEVD